MPNLFDFRSKKSLLQEQKDEYRKLFIKNCELFKSYINSPLLSVNEYRKAAQESFPQQVSLLAEQNDYSSIISNFESQLPGEIARLTDELTTFKSMAETQQVDSEESLGIYKKALDGGLSNIKESAEALIQQTNQDLTKLISMLASASFERSDPCFAMTDRIRSRAYLDLYSHPEPPAFLPEALSDLVATEGLPPSIREQLAGILEKLTLPRNAQFVVFSLNEAFKALPTELTEIVRNNKELAIRIQDLKKCLEEKKLVTPLEYYLATFQDYFSVFVRLGDDNRTIEADIKKQLEMFEAQYDKCDQVKLLVSEYRKKLEGLITAFDDETSIEHPSQLNKQLVELKNELQTGNLFQKVKQRKLEYLNGLEKRILGILNTDAKILQNIKTVLNNPNVEIERLIGRYQAKRREIETALKGYINDCHQLSSLPEIESFVNVSEVLGESYDPVIKEIRGYGLAADILYSSFKAISEFPFKNLTGSRERMALVSSLSDKVFYLLENLVDSQFGKCLENLLQVIEVEPSPASDAPSLLRREFRALVRQEKQLENFIEHHAEKVCEYLSRSSGGRWTKNEEFYSRLNGYLHAMKIDQLQALSEKRSDLRRTIGRVISTKQLLELQHERCNDSGSFWQTCVLFYEFNAGERPLPLFTTPENRDWFNSVREVINTLMQRVNLVDNKKTNYISSFFLCRDKKSKKRQALEKLKEQLEALPHRGNQQVLDEKLNDWEKRFGSTIDQPRYRFYLVVLMKLYHIFKYLTGQMVETESRRYVELLKESLYKASATMQTSLLEEGAASLLPPSPSSVST